MLTKPIDLRLDDFATLIVLPFVHIFCYFVLVQIFAKCICTNVLGDRQLRDFLVSTGNLNDFY